LVDPQALLCDVVLRPDGPTHVEGLQVIRKLLRLQALQNADPRLLHARKRATGGTDSFQSGGQFRKRLAVVLPLDGIATVEEPLRHVIVTGSALDEVVTGFP